MKRLALFIVALTCSFIVSAGKLPYSYYRIGNAGDVAGTGVGGGVVLMGGGTDVDAAFEWMCQRSGGGDFLVIRATGTDAYNPYIKALPLCKNVNSVATLIIPSLAAANDTRVAAIIGKAEALWIAGGDQSNYINYWQGTPVQDALDARVAADVPIGGTSAGLNVLTQFVYSAQASKGVTSSQALADPFNRYMSFARDFVDLPILAGIIGDPHFAARDRMGRDIAFLCRVYAYGWSGQPRGISVDEETALLIDQAGEGTVAGNGSVYFLQAPGAPEVCKVKTPLTYRGIAVYRIDASGSFDLTGWTGQGGVAYEVSAEAGVLGSTQADGAIY